MGRQGGIGIFVGSDRSINGYVDDGKPLCREKSSLDKKKWLKHPHMEGQRVAAGYFGAASLIAGNLWNGLPMEMRRLADGGAFNRLVGHCVMLVEDAGQLGDVDGLRNLDLSLDSSGPHRVACRGASDEGLGASRGFEYGLGKDRGHVSTCPYRLVGIDALCDELDAAAGCGVGKRSGKYLVAHRFVDDGIVRMPDFKAMGSCHGWGKAWRERSGQRLGSGRDLTLPKRPVRRVRVWVHATEVVRTEWWPNLNRYGVAEFARRGSEGVVSDWLVLKGYDLASAYSLQHDGIRLPDPSEDGTGVFVVFTAVEVSEKRGRHWVRLPWACKMRISDVVEVAISELAGSSEQVAVSELASSSEQIAVDRAVLVALPGRVVEGIGRRDWDFSELWDYWERQGVWLDSVMGTAADCVLSGESRHSLEDRGHDASCPYKRGELVRAGP